MASRRVQGNDIKLILESDSDNCSDRREEVEQEKESPMQEV
jgi:hypothetical protein